MPVMRTSPVPVVLSAVVTLAVAAALLQASVAPASADVIWEDGVPIFRDSPRPRSAPRTYAAPGYSVPFPQYMTGGPRPYVAPQSPPIVAIPNVEKPGTVVIDSSDRTLYYVLSKDEAYAYPISVGREGFEWTGVETVSRIADWPDWHPPAEMRQRQPYLPVKMTGGLRNPLGAKAIYLGNTLYRIHGTNDEKTIGQAASSGCFRMMNHHVVHLAQRVGVGTVVKVVKSWNGRNGGVAAVPRRPALMETPPLPERS